MLVRTTCVLYAELTSQLVLSLIDVSDIFLYNKAFLGSVCIRMLLDTLWRENLRVAVLPV